MHYQINIENNDPIVVITLKQAYCCVLEQLKNKQFCWFTEIEKFSFIGFTGYYINKFGTKYWYKNGRYHSDNDQPAIIWSDGSKYWYKNGQRHRDNDQPAVIWSNGLKEYWIEGNFIRKEQN